MCLKRFIEQRTIGAKSLCCEEEVIWENDPIEEGEFKGWHYGECFKCSRGQMISPFDKRDDTL